MSTKNDPLTKERSAHDGASVVFSIAWLVNAIRVVGAELQSKRQACYL